MDLLQTGLRFIPIAHWQGPQTPILETPKNLSGQGISIRTSQNSPGKRFKLVAALRLHDHVFGSPQSNSHLKIAIDLSFLWFCILTLRDWQKKKSRHFVISSESPCKTNCESLARNFPRFQICFKFSLVHWIVCVVKLWLTITFWLWEARWSHD